MYLRAILVIANREHWWPCEWAILEIYYRCIFSINTNIFSHQKSWSAKVASIGGRGDKQWVIHIFAENTVFLSTNTVVFSHQKSWSAKVASIDGRGDGQGDGKHLLIPTLYITLSPRTHTSYFLHFTFHTLHFPATISYIWYQMPHYTLHCPCAPVHHISYILHFAKNGTVYTINCTIRSPSLHTLHFLHFIIHGRP